MTLGIRVLDLVLSLSALVLLSPLMLLIGMILVFENGLPIFRQTRVGLNGNPFVLLKFRTMPPNTPSVATHHADASSITRVGQFLRRTKLDELPQLINVILGEMSIVGPRPCLFNQAELIAERRALGVFAVRPGITGLAQINNIDMSTPHLLAKTDKTMIDTMSTRKYLFYIVMTITGKGAGDRVKF